MNNSNTKTANNNIKELNTNKIVGQTVDKFGLKACKRRGISLLLDTSGSMK